MNYTVEEFNKKNLYGIGDGKYKGVKFLINDIETSDENENEFLIDHTVVEDMGFDFTEEEHKEEISQLIGRIIVDALTKISEMYKEKE